MLSYYRLGAIYFSSINSFYRSEIHEKMNCVRCGNIDSTQSGMHESTVEVNGIETSTEDYLSEPNVADIGGFAEISGCLHMLKSSQKQVLSMIYQKNVTIFRLDCLYTLGGLFVGGVSY